MCTVSFVPKADRGFILTSNRDETVLRPSALPIMQYSIDGKQIYFPKDPKAGGTWIATDGKQRTVCLLNGGFEPHDLSSGKVYRKSRGLVVLDVFSYANANEFAREYDFSGIEPFTLILVECATELSLTELRWDGEQLHQSIMENDVPRIWSSVTLYPKEVQLNREALFGALIAKNGSPSEEEIMHFHRWAGEGDQRYDLVMKQGLKQTVSICCLDFDRGMTSAYYHDLITDERSKHLIYRA